MTIQAGLAKLDNNNSSGLNKELNLYLARCTQQPSLDETKALNTFITSLKSVGVWSLLDALYVFNTNEYGSLGYNLVQPNFDCTIHTTNQAGFNPGYGIQGDGSSIWIDTNCNLRTSSGLHYGNGSNGSLMFMWSLTDNQGPAFDIGADDGVYQSGIVADNGGDSYYYTNYDQGFLPNANANGFTAWSKSLAGSTYFYQPLGSGSLNGSGANYSPANSNVAILRSGISGNFYSNNLIALCGFGARPTVRQMTSLYIICKEYLISSGSIDNNPAPPGPPRSVLPGYFTNNTIVTVKSVNGSNFRVYQQNPPPTSDALTNTSYGFYPVTDAATQAVDQLQPSITSSSIKGHHWIWHYRSYETLTNTGHVFNDRTNLIPPGRHNGTTIAAITTTAGYGTLPCRARYSTIAKAIAAVEVSIRYSLGYPAHVSSPTYLTMGYLDAANAAGIPDTDVYTWQYAYVNRSSVFSNYYKSRSLNEKTYSCLDKIILPDSRLYDAKTPGGIVLDSEAQDGRTPATLLTQLQNLANICANNPYRPAEFVVYPNPFNGSGAKNTGFDITNLYQIHQTPNLFLCPVAWQNNIEGNLASSLANQFNLLKGPNGDQQINYSKLLMTCSMSTSTGESFSSTDITTIRSYLALGMLGVMIWLDFGQAGGPLSTTYNQELAGILGLPTT